MTARLLDRASAVLFDLDGTLLDTARDLVAALERVCDENAQPLPDPLLAARYVSRGAAGLVGMAFGDTEPGRLEHLRQRLVDLYAEDLSSRTVPYPGIDTVLDHLDARHTPWGIVTNKPAALTEPLLERLGLRRRCAVVVSGDSTPNRKPHPEPVETAMRQIPSQGSTTLYIGDAPQDIASGRAAGAVTVAATWGYIVPGENPAEWQADYTIDHPEELLELSWNR